jgi:hypothetical protein
MGNIGSGFGNAASRCGFPDGYFPSHAKLGFPNCANYKGTQAQRIADLQKRGYGTDIIGEWNKYYKENPTNPLKIEYNVYPQSISYSMSKSDALAEKKKLDDFEGWFKSQFRKGGLTWADRVSMQTAAQSKRVAENIENRTIVIDSILSNTTNIKRWENEELELKQANERLLQIELESKRIEDQRLQDIENQRLQDIENQEITFNEQQNIGDYNETPITEINFDNSCSECTGTIKSTDPIEEKQLTENYLKIGGIAAVGIGILLLYTRRNKK